MGFRMSATPNVEPGSETQSDRLLWLAAAAVAGLGLTWLVISQPWSSGTETQPAAQSQGFELTAPAASRTTSALTSAADPQDALSSSLDNPLRMAQLAYEAGMLTEPEGYSAWTLYSRVLERDPDNEAARQGLDRVAADLLQRGRVALEQGRYEDTRTTVDRILGTLPGHTGAADLADRLDAMMPKLAPPPVPVAAQPPDPEIRATAPPAPAPPPAAEQPREQPRRESRPDPIVAAHEAFEQAMRENRLLAPAADSARHHVETMLAAQPEHELTRRDRELLVTELLARSTQALEALDTEAARTWIDEAEHLAADPIAVATARGALIDRLIAMESAKTLPASALAVVDYVAPVYPRIAATRELEGWVDLEFTVERNGSTRDITVADASHERYFRNEAIAAVERWRFEPRVFMDQTIEQRAFTRVRFVLAE
jgi:TonB family protein